jgi:hypothetical protein
MEIVHSIQPDIFVSSECLSGSSGDQFEAVRSYGGRVVLSDAPGARLPSWPPKSAGSLRSGPTAIQQSFRSSVLPRV